MNRKTQLFILFAGLIVIGVLFYLMNFAQHSQTKNRQENKQIQKSKTRESTQKTAVTQKHTAAQTKTHPVDTQHKAIPSYKEVFKETPAPKTDIERITEQEVITKLHEQSDALIKEADARIKEKNLKAATAPLSAEKIDTLQKEAEEIQNEIHK